MIFIIASGLIVGAYLVWSFLQAASYPMPHLSDEGEEEKEIF